MALRSRPTCSALVAFALLASASAPAYAGDAPASSPDDAAKTEAQALVTDGVALLKAKKYDEALEKFLTAYEKFPSPKILLNVGSTLRDMGRLADAANTYERYLEDPSTGAERVAEVKTILVDLDKKVALLVVQVTPPGADVSIDGGPWTTIGATLSTRVAAGPHLVRARKAGLEEAEVPVNGFEGQRKDVSIALKLQVAAEITTDTSAIDTHPKNSTATDTTQPKGDTTTGWMITGPHAGRAHARTGHSGNGDVQGEVHVTAVGPSLDHYDDHVTTTAPAIEAAPSNIEGSLQTRIDGKLRGAALAIGGAYDPTPSLQAEASLLLSKDLDGVIYGVYGGLRMRFLDGRVRPLVGAGVPIFWSGGAARVGVRAGAGAELLINEHLSLLADLGVEHFFNPQSRYEANVFVPVLGVHGRM
ncbi:MAG TPA: hypothetical protein VL463_21715 [Kofleriaceae bacterium]|jgi:hypothetical protein|nr:hypothetical protein [Kofleriaceae bacterium]